MGEQLAPRIDPTTIRTELLADRTRAPQLGDTTGRMISTGRTIARREHVLLGSIGQVGEYVRQMGHPNLERLRLTIQGVLRDIIKFPFNDEIESASSMDPDQIRRIIQDGEHIIIGPFAHPTITGEHSLIVPEVEGIWVPSGAAFGSGIDLLERARYLDEQIYGGLKTRWGNRVRRPISYGPDRC